MPKSDALNALTAELLAADVARHLALIARSQHRVACALASEQRPAVLTHLRSLGITEQSAAAYANVALEQEDMVRVVALLEAVEAWRPGMLDKVRALAIAG